jgi:DNA polymerase-4
MLWPYPIEAMQGMGIKTVPNLKLLGIQTIGDLAQYEDTEKLSKFLGSSTHAFQAKAWGHDETPVEPGKDQAQSLGQSRTYDPALFTIQEVLEELEGLTKLVHDRLIDSDLKTKSISISMRNHQFETRSKQTSLPFHTDDLGVMIETMETLAESLYQGSPVALVSISASHLEKKARLVDQINLFDVSMFPSKKEAIEDTLSKINAHYEKVILKKGDSHES